MNRVRTKPTSGNDRGFAVDRQIARIEGDVAARRGGGIMRFELFEREANSIDTVSAQVGPKPKLMALSYDTMSAVVSHPVYLHFACYPALEHGGATSFSFASTPHSPLAYQGSPPPAPTSEWRAEQFDYPRYGTWYDHYLVRGNVPAQFTFRGQQDQVRVASQSGPFILYRR